MPSIKASLLSGMLNFQFHSLEDESRNAVSWPGVATLRQTGAKFDYASICVGVDPELEGRKDLHLD